MTKLWRLPIFIITWALFLCIKVPTLFLGLFVAPFLWRYRHTNYVDLPWWTRPWSNLEDWQGQVNSFESSLPRWWYVSKGKGFWSFYHYYAIRNGADGLRSFEWLDLDVDKDKVRYWSPKFFDRYEPGPARELKISTIGYLAWQGWRSGMKLVHVWNDERHFVMKLGWSVEPSDTVEPHGPASLNQNEGFSTKLLVYRKG